VNYPFLQGGDETGNENGSGNNKVEKVKKKKVVVLPIGPYKYIGAAPMPEKLNRKKIKLAGGNNIVTRDEDPRVDMVLWASGVLPKSTIKTTMQYPPYQHESWTVTQRELRRMLRQDVRNREPYTRINSPPINFNLRQNFADFLTRQRNVFMREGMTEEDIVRKNNESYCCLDEKTGVLKLCFNGVKKFEFQPPRLLITKLDDETVKKFLEPCGKINYQDVFHQTMKEKQLEKIKEHEEREKRREKLEMEQRKSSSLNVPNYQPGVKGTPKVPRLEPQWLSKQNYARTSKSTPRSSIAADPPYVWPTLPDEDEDDGDVDEEDYASEPDLPKKVCKKKKKVQINGKIESSTHSKRPPLLLKIKKNLKRSYESMICNAPVQKTTSQPKIIKVQKEPRIKPSIASISGPEEQKKLETIKQKIEIKQEKTLSRLTAPVVIVDPKIQKEKRKALEKAKKEQEREAKLAEALAKTRGPALPSTCVGSLNPERPVINGDPYVTDAKPLTNGCNGIRTSDLLKNYRIPKRTATIYSMPDLLLDSVDSVDTSVNQSPPGQINGSLMTSCSEDRVNGVITPVSVNKGNNISEPSKSKVFIPVASDEDLDDDDVIDLFANVDEDDLLLGF